MRCGMKYLTAFKRVAKEVLGESKGNNHQEMNT